MTVAGAITVMVRRRRFVVWGALGVVLGLALGIVPLFGVLGYELALAASWFAAFASLDLGAALARELARAPGHGVERASFPGRTLATTALAASVLGVGVTLLPAIICAVRGIWVPTCDWPAGIAWYVALPLATAALGGATGHAIGAAVGPRRWLCAALAQLPILLCAIVGLVRFYTEPPVFVFSPVIGYFQGNLYDTTIQITGPLVWSRVEQLLWVAAIVALVASRLDVPSFRWAWRAPRPAGRRWRPLALALGCTLAAGALHANAGRLGYAVDGDDLDRVLSGRIETAHFVIHYAHTREIDRDIKLIAADHELRYAEVVAQLGVAPPGKLQSYYFANANQKARWFGARQVEITKPWQHAIYIDHHAFPHPSLRHEIAHAVASAFGDPIFGVAAQRVAGLPLRFDPGLIEGLAVAIDWPGAGYPELTPHEDVRVLQAMGVTPSIAELQSLGFLTMSSARSYVTAGSFVRFLLDRYGAADLRAVYHSGGDFAAAYGVPLATLVQQWRQMIATIHVPDDVIAGRREAFRRGGIFAQPCPHAIADARERAYTALAGGDRQRAIALMRHVCRDAPDDPGHALELGDFLIDGTQAERDEARGLWTHVADLPNITSTMRDEAIERLARLAALHDDLATTRALLARASKLPVDPDHRRQIDAEQLALDHAGPAGAALRGYFFAPGGLIDGESWAQLAVLAEPDLGLGHYLLGLQVGGRASWQLADDELSEALAEGLPGVLFERNAARKLAIAAYRVGDLASVRLAIATLERPEMMTSDHLLGEDWARRLTFDATGHL